MSCDCRSLVYCAGSLLIEKEQESIGTRTGDLHYEESYDVVRSDEVSVC
jgi:hypothetical protein